MLIFSIICFIATILFLILRKKKFITVNFDLEKHYKKIVIALFLIILLTSFYDLGNVMDGIHIDEAGMAYDAMSLDSEGVDRYLNKYPVYFINFGGGQSVMMGYLVSFLLKIFDFSLFIVRVPSALIKIILVVCGFLIVKDKKERLLLLFLLAINPYFIMQARFGLDCNLMVGFITIATFLLHKKIESNKSLLIPGIFFGLSLYTYALSYITIPIYLFFICIYLLYIKKTTIKKLIVFGLPIFLLAIPLILLILVNSGYLPQLNSIITIPEMLSYRGSEISLNNIFINLYIIPSILSFDMPFVFGNLLTYNSSYQFGTIYYMAIPFFIIGILKTFKQTIIDIKKKNYSIDSIIVFWFLASLICQLLIVQPNINKANAIMFPVVYFVFKGLYLIFKNYINLILPFIILLSINFIVFIIFLFTSFTTRTNDYDLFYNDFVDALSFSLTLDEDLFYVDGRAIYSNLLLETNPYDYNEYKVVGESQTHIYDLNIITNNAGYIVHKDNNINNSLSKMSFKVESFGKYKVYYK